jgi:hypothetical protein
LPSPVVDEIARLYQQFATYDCPRNLWVCPQCGPEWSAAEIRSAPVQSLSLAQLTAVHIMPLDDDGLRYFFPRLVDLLISEQSPWFDFRLSDLKDRLQEWLPAESTAVRHLIEIVWRELLNAYPAALGYFSDAPSTLDFIDYTDTPLAPFLQQWESLDKLSATRHLAEMVDHVFTTSAPIQPEVLTWLGRPAIGERLQGAFFAAGSEEAEAQLAAAHELWTFCR